MANVTILGLPEVESVDLNDWIPVWDVSGAITAKARRVNILGDSLTGTGTEGRIAQWGAGELLDSTLIKSGAGVLTLAAAADQTLTLTGGGTLALGGFTLTVPATGTAALLGTAQTFGALKTFSAGINLGQTNLTYYEEGNFTVTLIANTGTITINTAEDTLAYTRIGRQVFVQGMISVSTVSSPAGAVTLSGLPFAIANLAEQGERFASSVLTGNFNTSLTTPLFIRNQLSSGTALTFAKSTGTGTFTSDVGPDFANGALLYLDFSYIAA